MSKDQLVFLNLEHFPARLTVNQTAWFLGFNESDVAVLVAAKMLEPLGTPAASGSKYFATVKLQEHAADEEWLDEASEAMVRHWKKKNSNRRKPIPLPVARQPEERRNSA